MPTILFLHENYPAQFGALADTLAKSGWQVVFATQKESLAERKRVDLPSGVRVFHYARTRDGSKETHNYLTGTETAILNGQGFARLGYALKKRGFAPDIIVAHSGWGSGSFAKTVWPEARLVQYLEWWYHYPAVDHVPGMETTRPAEDQAARTLVRNLPFLLDFQQADLVVAPTAFQGAQAPAFVQDKMVIQHDGVDCAAHRPWAEGDARFQWEGLPDEAPIVTFATRGMEPQRGFHTFMEAAARVQAVRPDAHIVIAGNDSTHYGAKTNGKTWKERALEEHDFDLSRLHFTGLLPRESYGALLQRSDAHTYLTAPFVLSWSFVESMATGAPLVASDVAPVVEAIGDSDGARMVPFGDAAATAEALIWCLDHPSEAREMGLRARARALSHYDRPVCHAALEAQYRELLG